MDFGGKRERDHLKDPDIEEDNIKMDIREVGWRHGRDRSG
jgi:hypothetical protein